MVFPKLLLIFRVPAFTVVVPEYVFAPSRVRSPVPVLVRLPAPLITSPYVTFELKFVVKVFPVVIL